jgi:outer membrane protein assembly factor BamB
MPWTLATSRAPRRTDGRRVPLLAVLTAALSAAALAGCGPPSSSPSTSAAQPTPDLHFVIDGNYMAAKSASDLRSSLVALNARDGHVAWRHALEASSSADATVSLNQPVNQDGLVYVSYYYEHAVDPQNVVRHGVLEVLDAATGAARWRREIGTEIAGEPVVDGATVFVSATVLQAQGQAPPALSGLLEALDVRTGAVRWQRPLEDTPSMPASAAGRVFVMVNQQLAGDLLALDASNGSLAWNYSSGPLTRGGDVENSRSDAPLVVADRVYVQTTERNSDGAASLSLLALNASNGHMAWQHDTGGIAATPAFNQSGNTVCLSTFTSSPMFGSSVVEGLDAATGKARWSVEVAGILSACAATGDAFYLTEAAPHYSGGSVVALSSQDGRERWKTTTGPAVDADGLLAPAVSSGVVGVYLQGPAATRGPVMSTIAVLRSSGGTNLWRHDFDGRPGQVLDMEGDLIFNPELSGDVQVITAYAHDTGTLLWSYTLGHL